MAKKIFILGTQSLVSSENSTLRFGGDNEIIIPLSRRNNRSSENFRSLQ